MDNPPKDETTLVRERYARLASEFMETELLLTALGPEADRERTIRELLRLEMTTYELRKFHSAVSMLHWLIDQELAERP